MRRLSAIVTAAVICMAIGAASPASAVPSSKKSYSAAEVKKHRTAKDCWSIVNGAVYDLTPWVSRHPGGSSRIVAMCGRDASAAFNDQHGSQKKASRALAQFRIGTAR